MSSETSQNLDAKAKQLIEFSVALPAAHFLFTSVFLVGYYQAFGFNVARFSSPSDLFSASISDIGPAYISWAILPILVILFYRTKYGHWSIYDAAMAKSTEIERTIALEKANKDRKEIIKSVIFIGFFQLIIAFVSFDRDGFIRRSTIGGLILFIFAFTNAWVSEKIQISSIASHFSYILGMLLILSFFNGMSKGQDDRRSIYNKSEKDHAFCGNFVILRPIGSLFLSVGNDNKKYLITPDCKMKFKINVKKAQVGPNYLSALRFW